MSDQGSPPPPGSVPAPGPQQPWYPQPGQPPPYGTVPPPPPPPPPPPGYYPPQPYPAQPYPAQAYPPHAYPPPPQGYAAYPPMMVAAHKPGAIPIRPLRLGDMFDAAFKIIRANPGATVGSAVLVTAVATAVPLLITGILTAFLDFSLTSISSDDSTNTTLGASSLLQVFGLIFVTGMVTHVAAAAALGRRLSLGGAWAATAGKRWKLVGLSLLLFAAIAVWIVVVVLLIVVVAVTLPTAAAVLLGILLGLAGIAGLAFFWGKVYYLAVPPLMLEDVGVFGALGRAWSLTHGHFWRTFGIGLLTVMITQVIGGIIAIPFSIIGVVAALGVGDGETGLLLFLIANGLATVASSAFVAPFSASVTAVQYLDLRIRKEGYDVELLSRAGLS